MVTFIGIEIERMIIRKMILFLHTFKINNIENEFNLL